MSPTIGVAGIAGLGTGDTTVLSEIAFPPSGYVLCFSSKPPDERLVDITIFANAALDDRREFHLRLPVLP